MYIGETNNLRLRINLHRDHAKKNTGLGVSKHIFSCSIKLHFPLKVMPFYKMFTYGLLYCTRTDIIHFAVP